MRLLSYFMVLIFILSIGLYSCADDEQVTFNQPTPQVNDNDDDDDDDDDDEEQYSTGDIWVRVSQQAGSGLDGIPVEMYESEDAFKNDETPISTEVTGSSPLTGSAVFRDVEADVMLFFFAKHTNENWEGSGTAKAEAGVFIDDMGTTPTISISISEPDDTDSVSVR